MKRQVVRLRNAAYFGSLWVYDFDSGQFHDVNVTSGGSLYAVWDHDGQHLLAQVDGHLWRIPLPEHLWSAPAPGYTPPSP